MAGAVPPAPLDDISPSQTQPFRGTLFGGAGALVPDHVSPEDRDRRLDAANAYFKKAQANRVALEGRGASEEELRSARDAEAYASKAVQNQLAPPTPSQVQRQERIDTADQALAAATAQREKIEGRQPELLRAEAQRQANIETIREKFGDISARHYAASTAMPNAPAWFDITKQNEEDAKKAAAAQRQAPAPIMTPLRNTADHVVGAVAEGFRTPARIVGEYGSYLGRDPDLKPEDVREAFETARKFIDASLPGDEARKNDFWSSQVAQGAGSSLPFLVMGLAGKAVGLGEKGIGAVIGVTGALQQAGSEEEKFDAALKRYRKSLDNILSAETPGNLAWLFGEERESLRSILGPEQYERAARIVASHYGSMVGVPGAEPHPDEVESIKRELTAAREGLDHTAIKRAIVMFANAGIGATEAIPIANALERVNKLSGGGFTRILKAGGINSIEEAVQESFQNWSANEVTKFVYDLAQESGEGVWDATVVAAVIGLLQGGGIQAYHEALGRGKPPGNSLPIPPVNPPPPLTPNAANPISPPVTPASPAPTPHPVPPGAGSTPSTATPPTPTTAEEAAARISPVPGGSTTITINGQTVTVPPSAAPPGAAQTDAADLQDLHDTVSPELRNWLGNVDNPTGTMDQLYERARDLVRTDGKASTSYIQRKLGLGYGQAAAIVERLEADGVVSSADQNGKRTILPAAGTRAAPIKIESEADIERIGAVGNQDHTPAQGEANNIQRDHADWHGLGVTIEAPSGGARRGVAPDGTMWEQKFSHPYGYLKGIKGADGQELDAYVLGAEPQAFVLDELDEKTGKFRQHKVFLGAADSEAARQAYLGTQDKKESQWGGGRMMTADEFKEWSKGDLNKPLMADRNRQSQASHNRILRAYGYSQFQIDRMGEKERIKETYDAVQSGVKDPGEAAMSQISPSNEGEKIDMAGGKPLTSLTSPTAATAESEKPAQISTPAPEHIAAAEQAIRSADSEIHPDDIAELSKLAAGIYAQGNGAISHQDAVRAAAASYFLDRGLITDEQAEREYGQKITELLQAQRRAKHSVRQPAENTPTVGPTAASQEGSAHGVKVGENAAHRPGGQAHWTTGQAAAAGSATNGRGNINGTAPNAGREQATQAKTHPEGFFDRQQEDIAPEREIPEAQYVIPGAERISMKEHLERKAREPKRAPKRGTRVKSRVKEIESAGGPPPPPSAAPQAPKTPKTPRSPPPMSAMTYLASRGGLKPNSELKKLGFNYKTRVVAPGMGWRNVLRKDGMTMTQAWEALIEGEYIPSPSPNTPTDSGHLNDIYKMLDAEHGQKQPTFPQGQENADVEDRARREAKAGEEELDGYEDAVRAMLEETGEMRNLTDPDHYIRLAAYIMATEGLSADNAWPAAVERDRLEDGLATADELIDIYDLGDLDALYPKSPAAPENVATHAPESGRGEGSGAEGEARERGGSGQGISETGETPTATVPEKPERIAELAVRDRKTGKIWRGKSIHSDLGEDAAKELGISHAQFVGRSDEGYITSRGRFVDRTEAAKIAAEADQINGPVREDEFGEYLSHDDLKENALEPTEERGAEGKPQLVFPGMEKISDAEQAQRGADKPLKPKAEQKSADEGLFGDTGKQADLTKQEPKKEAPIVQFRRDAEAIKRSLPPVEEGHTRLWRGNRPGEVGKNPSFTNDLPGIALPFLKGYRGALSYVDVSTSDLKKYEQKIASAPGAEFILPAAMAAQAKIAKPEPVAAEKPVATKPEKQAEPSTAKAAETGSSVSAPAEIPFEQGLAGKGTVIYRAHNGDDRGLTSIHPWTAWSPEKETAEAYQDNPGFGGPNLRAAKVDAGDRLKVSLNKHGFRKLAEELGYDNPEEAGNKWWDANVRYPWEEFGEVAKRIEKSDYKWIEYEDDFPDGATTWVAVKPIKLEKSPGGTGKNGASAISAQAEPEKTGVVAESASVNEKPVQNAQKYSETIPAPNVTEAEATRKLEEARQTYQRLNHTLDGLHKRLEKPVEKGRNALDQERLNNNRAISERNARNLVKKVAEALDAVDDARKVRNAVIEAKPSTAVTADTAVKPKLNATAAGDEDIPGFLRRNPKKEDEKAHNPTSDLDQQVKADSGSVSRETQAKTDEQQAADIWNELLGPTENTPPKVEPPKAPTKPASPAKPKAEWKEIGRNSDGRMLYEDERGVRSYVENGVRVSETVALHPTKGAGFNFSVDRSGKPEWQVDKPAEQAKAPQQTYASLVSDDTGRVPHQDVIARIQEMMADGMSSADAQAKIAQMIRDAETQNPERTAGQSAASAAKNVGKGALSGVEGLFQLFNTKTKNVGIGFNKDTWEQAKPFFIQATKDFSGAWKDMREFAKKLFEALTARGLHIDDMKRMQPYLEHFTVEVTRGNIDLNAEQKAPISDQEQNNERTGPEKGNPGKPDQTPSEGGGRPETGGNSGRGDAGAGGRGAGSDGATDEARVPGARGEGSGPGGNAKAGGSGRGAGVGKGRTGSDGKRVPRKSPGTDGRGREPVGPVTPQQAPSLPAVNFKITDEVNLGEGSEAAKFRDNIAAIDTLKEIERDQRRATPDEQRILARYVGWGGLANAFRQPETQEFKPDWKARGEQLENSMTKEELRAARSSTQYAHYTSRTVIDAMWDAVKQMGFNGGIAIETSAGVGNFIGLVPDDITGSTRFVAIEKDGISARIAQMLYPQETVLHAPFEAVPLPDGEATLVIGNPPFSKQSLMFQNKPELTGLSMHNQFLLAGLDALRPGGIQAVVVSRYVMDAQDTKAREMMAVKASLIGAVRLPDTAFRENARTDVVTDILFFQRRTKAEEDEFSKNFEDYKKARAAQIKSGHNIPNAIRAFLAAYKAPTWTETAEVKDPLGGAPMTVNQYFASNPKMIMGRLERSGTMQMSSEEGKGVNVTLDGPLAPRLAEAVAKIAKQVPTNVGLQHDVLAASLARHEAMSESLSIALAGSEVGHVERSPDGKLTQVSERETPSGDYELTSRVLSPSSPWSRELSMDKNGNWYVMEARTAADAIDERIDALQERIKAYDANQDVSLAYAARNELASLLDKKGRLKPGELAKDGKRNIYGRKFFPNNEVPAGLRLGENRYQRLVEAVNLRDLTKRQLTMEAQDAQAAQMEDNRRKLARTYEGFVGRHGLLNDGSNARLINDMPDGAIVLALEFSYRPPVTNAKAARTGEKARPAIATPAPILSRRVVPKYEPATKADSAADAVSIVLSESGRINMERVAGLLGVDEAGAIEKLTEGEKPLAYFDPETKTYEPRNAYLSGQVAKKLAAARAAGLSKNAADLEAVLPARWTAENVTAIIGNNWIPPETYAAFANHLLGTTATAHYSRATNAFALYVGGYERERQDQWGTPDMPADAILRGMLNSKVPKVLDPPDDNGTRRVNQELSTLVLLKSREIENEFADWVFKDNTRRNQLVDIYNEKFNTRVTRQHDGSHLTLPGKVPDEVIKLRRHQKNAVWRGVYERFMLLDHVVGAGKTIVAIARAMERRRMGMSRKPLVAVPNHLVDQWVQDIYRLYPGAKVLSAGRNQFDRKNRRRLFARIATGDWDMIIVPHSSFGFIGIDPATELRFLDNDLRIAMEAVQEAKQQAAADGIGGQYKPFTVKEAEKLVESIQARMEKLKSGNQDKMLTFEQMGVDDLTVDECFPHDTPILTDSGWLPIGEVVEKKLLVSVASHNKETNIIEWKPVIRWIPIRSKKAIVRVSHERGHFTCTFDHKIWTDRGYVQAQALLPSDHLHVMSGDVYADRTVSESVRNLLASEQTVRTVRGDVQIPQSRAEEQRHAPVLPQRVCSNMAQRSAGTEGSVQRLDDGSSWRFDSRQEVACKFSAHEGQQSDDQPSECREDASFFNRANVPLAGRQFNIDRSAEDVGNDTLASDGIRNRDSVGARSVPEPTDELQSRYSLTETQIGYRSGRRFTQNPQMEISGQAQDIYLERSRMVGVEVLEPGSDGRSGESGVDYSTVYDIEVEGNHNFIAAGVLVSNCHEFKNLFYSSRLTGVRGMGDKTGSKKAFDLYNKVRVLRESPTGTVTFMTGTPISNSAVEMFTILRYLAAQELKDLGLEHFDAWRSQYVSAQPAFEPTEAGGLKEVTRLGRSWSNMRALMELYYSFTDAVSQDDINKWHAEDNNGARFPVPMVKGGGRQEVVVKPTEAQLDELGGIVAGFNMLPEMRNPIERNKMRLRLMDRARKVSLDVRAANPMSDSKEVGGKLDQITENVVRIYRATTKDKGTQLVFLDRSVKAAKTDAKTLKEYDHLVGLREQALKDNNEESYRSLTDKLDEYDTNEMEEVRRALKGGWNAYDQLKENLVKLGIPENEIRFVQEANNEAEKKALFDLVREGSVRVLIGSTPRMGAGTNVQRRLVALHHGDVTWKPSDIEQREGRIIRQADDSPDALMKKYGDKFEVEILAYATERTIDAKMWDLNSQKLKTINGIRKYNGEFNMEFEDEDAVGMAEIAALASGDPLLLERVKLMSQIDKIEMLERAHRRRMFGIDDQIQGLERAERDYPAMIDAGKKKADILKQGLRAMSARAADRSVTVEGKKYTSLMEAAKAINDSIETQKGGEEKARYTVMVDGQRLTNKVDLQDAIESALGDSAPIEVQATNGETWRRRSQIAKELSRVATKAVYGFQGDDEQRAGGNLGKLAGFDLNWGVARTRWGDVVSLWLEHNGIALADGEKTLDRGKTKQDVTQQLARSAIENMESRAVQEAGFTGDYLQQRIDEAKTRLPTLRQEKATAKFPQAEEMATLRKRLEEVIRTLDERTKAEERRSGHQGEAPPPNELHQPGSMFSLNREYNVTTDANGKIIAKPAYVFEPRGSLPLGMQAQMHVMRRGIITGLEHLTAIDAGGNVVDSLLGTSHTIKISDKLAAALDDPSQSVVVHHNHPNDYGFSNQDLSTLGHPGMAALWAHGHRGTIVRAALTPEARARLGRMPSADTRSTIARVVKAIENSFASVLIAAADQRIITEEQGNRIEAHGIALALHQAGVIDYGFHIPAVEALTAKLPQFNNLISRAANLAAGELLHGTAVMGGRPAQIRGTQSHPGEVGTAFENARSRSTGPGNASVDRTGEGSNRPDQGTNGSPPLTFEARRPKRFRSAGPANRQPQLPRPYFAPLHTRVRAALNDPTLSLTERYSAALGAMFLPAARKLWDKIIDLARLQRAAEMFNGAPIPQRLDTHIAAILYPGKTGERLLDASWDLFHPIYDEMKARNVSADELQDFLYARHAEERNNFVGAINPPGTQFHDAVTNHSLVGASGMSTDEANQILSHFAVRRPDFDAVAQMVDAVTQHNRDLMETEGLEHISTLMTWQRTYQNYVPLMGEEAGSEDEYGSPPLQKGFSTRGPESMRALGRGTRAGYILAHLLDQTNRLIIRAERNSVGKTFARFVIANPNPDLYKVGLATTRRAVNPQTGMVELEWVTTPAQHDRAFAFKVAGDTHYIEIAEGQEGLLLALKNFGIPRFGKLMRAAQWMTRTWSTFQTAKDPEFVTNNFERDIQEAGLALTAEQRSGFQKAYWKNLTKGRSFLAAVLGMAGRTNNRYGQLYEDWRHDGGKISVFGYKDVETIEADIRREMSRRTESMTWKIAAQPWRLIDPIHGHIVRLFEVLNEIMESTTRLAVYAAGRDIGLTRAQSASASRAMTVDFSRGGEAKGIIQALWAFSNPAIQGQVNLVRRLKSRPFRYIYGVGIPSLAFTLTLWNLWASGSDDDDEKKRTFYEEMKQWDRDQNIVFFTPGAKDAKKISLNFMARPAWAIGENAAMAMMGKIKPSAAIGNFIGSTAQAFNPLGSNGSAFDLRFWAKTVAPTFLDPIIELGFNRDWLNRPVHPDEASWNRGTPHSEQSKMTTSPHAESAAQWVNRMTGGTTFKKGVVDPYPDDLEYAWNFVLGGYGKFVLRGADMLRDRIDGIDTPVEKIPFVRRMITEGGSEQQKRETFYEKHHEADERSQQLRNAVRAQRSGKNVEDAERTIDELAGKVGARITGARNGVPTVSTQAEQAFRDADRKLSQLRAEERKLRRDPDLTRVERMQQVKTNRKEQLDIMKNARERYNSIAGP